MHLITTCDDGTVRDPQGGEWDGWVAATRLRNHVLGNPLLDWLDEHGEARGFTPDPPGGETDFRAFIMGKGIRFEADVVDLIAETGIGDVQVIGGAGSPSEESRSLTLAEETWTAMNEGRHVIAQGVLRDPDRRLYGRPDLLVRSDTLTEIVPSARQHIDSAARAEHLDIGDLHYVVVDIKYMTLKMNKDGSLSNSGNNLAYKTQLDVYNRALGRIQGHLPKTAFLLGRGWKLNKGTRVDNCLDRLAPVAAEEQHNGSPISYMADKAALWIRRMREDGHEWAPLPEPTFDELRPNASADNGQWTAAVGEIAEQTRDLTVLWRVGHDKRCCANSIGIFKWDDGNATPDSLGVAGEKAVAEAASHPRREQRRPRNRAPTAGQISPLPLGAATAVGVLRRLRNSQRPRRRLPASAAAGRAASHLHGRVRPCGSRRMAVRVLHSGRAHRGMRIGHPQPMVRPHVHDQNPARP